MALWQADQGAFHLGDTECRAFFSTFSRLSPPPSFSQVGFMVYFAFNSEFLYAVVIGLSIILIIDPFTRLSSYCFMGAPYLSIDPSSISILFHLFSLWVIRKSSSTRQPLKKTTFIKRETIGITLLRCMKIGRLGGWFFDNAKYIIVESTGVLS